MSAQSFRRDSLTRPIFAWARKALPTMSDTEREALEAGDVWWDGELFTGNPDWSKLLETPMATLTPEERAFLDGPTEELCRMLQDWRINWELRDLPPEVWAFLKAHLRDLHLARQQNLITDAEDRRLEEMEKAVAAVVAVDDFAAAEIASSYKRRIERAAS